MNWFSKQMEWDAAFACHAGAPLVWISMINTGYLGFARHFQRNLDALGLALPLVVACTDAAAYAGAVALGMAAVRMPPPLNDTPLATALTTWSTPEYRAVTFVKLDALRAALAAARRASIRLVGFIDFDIALLRDPSPAVVAAAAARPDVALWAQCEEPRGRCGERPHAPCPKLCSGVLALRTDVPAADACLAYTAADVRRHACDQEFLQEAWDAARLPRASLDRVAFPNGLQAGVDTHASRPRLRGAVLVHFNWLEAAAKVPTMRRWRLWHGEGESLVTTQQAAPPAGAEGPRRRPGAPGSAATRPACAAPRACPSPCPAGR